MIKSEEKTMNPQDCKKTVIFNSIVEEKKKKKDKKTLCNSEGTNYFTRLSHSSNASLSLTSLLIVFSIHYH